MGIDINDPVKSLSHQRVTDVIAEIHEHFFTNGNGPRKSHVMFVESIMDNGQGQHQSIGAARRLFGDIFYSQVVHIDRQMKAMLFNRGDRNDDHSAILGSLLDFRPLQKSVEMRMHSNPPKKLHVKWHASLWRRGDFGRAWRLQALFETLGCQTQDSAG